jgi:hypothetical protein
MDAIRERSAAQRKRGKVRTLVISAAISLAMVGTAAAFGTNIYNGVRLWITGSTSTVTIQSFVLVKEPTAADLRNVAGKATFPVVLPVGLPASEHLWRLEYAPAQHPNALFLDYRNERTGLHATFALFDSSSIQRAKSPPAEIAAITGPLARQYRWSVGSEAVIAGSRGLSGGMAGHVKAAMKTSTPASSLAVTLTGLSTAIVMVTGPPANEDLGVTYAPRGRPSVVLGPRFPPLIARLARTNRPLLDAHVVDLTNIPAAPNGQPDYSKATLQWPRTVAIPAPGVRAVNRVLHETHAGSDCGCLIFFNGRSKGAYSVWLLNLSTRALHKYLVK